MIGNIGLRLIQLCLLLATATQLSATQNPSKRGLVHVRSEEHPEDDEIWLKTAGDGAHGAPQEGANTLRWYYNYMSTPTFPVKKERDDTGLEFVPMLWGYHANSFLNDVRKLKAEGYMINYVLGFNEPDMSNDVGGSGVSPEQAALSWRSDIQPLRQEGVKLGAPAVASTEQGRIWLEQFVELCANCTFDFIPLHWYGDFQGLASHLGYYHAWFPNATLWLTELGFAHQELDVTQEFFNVTMEYLDRLEYVERYAWFGSFRSSVSNVGPNAAMLNEDGQLTDIGSWYLGGNGSGIVPSGQDSGTSGTPGRLRVQALQWAFAAFAVFSALV
ncbi:glycosyl hydrolase catalytic core-domain-containing protein [Kalaharituber pfeilii]|nr:glycosyl hydrolase catalytic core-domain-containing protein [Kalaharituber pfeilii]